MVVSKMAVSNLRVWIGALDLRELDVPDPVEVGPVERQHDGRRVVGPQTDVHVH